MSELVPAAEIMRHVQRGTVDNDVSPDDIEKETGRWAAGDHHDQRVATAYRAVDRALEQGRQVIDLQKTIQKAGKFSGGTIRQYMPALAVARADIRNVRCRVTEGQATYATNRRTRIGRRLPRWNLTIDSEKFSVPPGRDWAEAQARAPHIPPNLRPENLRDHYLLWEASWVMPRQSRAPMALDPALLEPIVGHLYLVVATWELSELEEAALRD